jgi:hypothetical protein
VIAAAPSWHQVDEFPIETPENPVTLGFTAPTTSVAGFGAGFNHIIMMARGQEWSPLDVAKKAVPPMPKATATARPAQIAKNPFFGQQVAISADGHQVTMVSSQHPYQWVEGSVLPQGSCTMKDIHAIANAAGRDGDTFSSDGLYQTLPGTLWFTSNTTLITGNPPLSADRLLGYFCVPDRLLADRLYCLDDGVLDIRSTTPPFAIIDTIACAVPPSLNAVSEHFHYGAFENNPYRMGGAQTRLSAKCPGAAATIGSSTVIIAPLMISNGKLFRAIVPSPAVTTPAKPE